ncbi:MAG: hypothetical protein U9Q07_03170, partial [Planctomycetota bacterium]|nr:hypothetical protein [Planctomycetota bacterium]
RGVSKAKRAAATWQRHPNNAVKTKDRGHDAADAIGMADWWLDSLKIIERQKAIEKLKGAGR